MNLTDIVHRTMAPVPWAEGEKIPWHAPAFSERMLREHLSQEHDAASRRRDRIDAHVRWVHGALLAGRPTRVLDLGCGPGLYTSRLARLGHECLGLDYSPASIRYARERAAADGLSCSYVEADVRSAEFGSGFGLAMMVYGEVNVFRPCDAQSIVAHAHAALKPGGVLLLEAHTFGAVQRAGQAGATWRSLESGLFSDRPHLWLEEGHWDAESRAATTRYYIVDAATGDVERYASTMQGYTDEEYRALLASTGFVGIRSFPSLTGDEEGMQEGLFVLTGGRA
jgi:SAM-dependent methyltransferase